MSEASADKAGAENIDVIRDLLRKLEEVAAKDGESSGTSGAVPEPGTGQTRAIAAASELSTLQRSGVPVRQRAIELPEIVSRPPADIVPIDLRPGQTIEARAEPEQRRRGIGLGVAAMSFGFGLVTAMGLIFIFDPLQQFRAPARQAEPLKPGATPPVAVEVAAKPETAAPVAVVSAQEGPRAEEASEATRRAAVERRAPESSSLPEPQREPNVPAPVAVAEAVPPPAPVVEVLVEVPAANLALPGGLPPIDPPPVAPGRATVQKPAGVVLAVPARLELRAGERRSLGLKLEPMPDEAAALLVVIRNVPAWLALTQGSALGADLWFMPARAAGDLEVVAGENADGKATLKVQLATADGRILYELETVIEMRRAAVPVPSSASQLARQSSPEQREQGANLLFARGAFLIDTGEIEAARTLLRSAAEAGSVAAALKLAETYDPAEMPRLGMTVAGADLMLATRWYQRAEALGSQVATARLATLGRR